jgi:hypothetical protein
MIEILCYFWILTERDESNYLLWSLLNQEFDQLLNSQSLLSFILNSKQHLLLGKGVGLLVDRILIEIDLPSESGELVIKCLDGFVECWTI